MPIAYSKPITGGEKIGRLIVTAGVFILIIAASITGWYTTNNITLSDNEEQLIGTWKISETDLLWTFNENHELQIDNYPDTLYYWVEGNVLYIQSETTDRLATTDTYELRFPPDGTIILSNDTDEATLHSIQSK